MPRKKPASVSSARASTRGPAHADSSPSFKETFVAVGRQELDKGRAQKSPVFSVAVPVTVLMVVAAVAYTWWPVVSVVALVCAVILLWGRGTISRQTTRDLTEMRASREGYRADRNPEYLDYIRLRGEQMLRDNKALTAVAKSEIRELLDWEKARR